LEVESNQEQNNILKAAQFCVAFVILFGSKAINFGIDVALLHFCMLIKKDGGIRPNEVLATCNLQGAKFYSANSRNR